MAKSRSFLLGVGAQKSGTSWVYEYLRSMGASVNMGALKEYHVFDVIFLNDPTIRRKYLQERIRKGLNPVDFRGEQHRMALDFIGNTDAYFDYFSSLLDEKNTTLSGDITPSYAGLPKEAFILIRESLKIRGIEPKVLFLLRDPVERCISAARFQLRQQGVEHTALNEIQTLKENYAKPAFEYRTRYDRTIDVLDDVFDASEVKLIFYENLFGEQSLRELCEFLCVEFQTPDYGRRINESRTENIIPEMLRREIAEFYRPVYEFMMNRYSREAIASMWDSCKFL